jgi:hypothetical protein
VNLDDAAFDDLVPEELRHLSAAHWTPVAVAVRAAALLAPGRDTRVLDVGAGVGKLCAVGALSSDATWCGVEQHEILVTAARRVAVALGIGARTSFIHGDVLSIDWAAYDALYLYNPFELDHGAAVARVQDRLAGLRGGTRVLTFNGFGGVMPASYDLLHHERVDGVGLDLALWRQRYA